MSRHSRAIRTWWDSLTLRTQVTAGIFGFAFTVFALAAILRTSQMSPRWLLIVMAAGMLAQAVYALVRGPRFSTLEAMPMLIGAIAFTGVRTWSTGVDLAALANGANLSIMAVYVVWFLPPLIGRAVLYVACGWWLAAIIHRDEPMLTGLGVLVVLQALIGAEIFYRIRASNERMAYVDVLTGVANRRGVVRICERYLTDLTDRGVPFSIISIDLDGLRDVNNSNGHHAGDALLIEACRHWATVLRPRDFLGRLGGDEFVIVLRGVDALGATRVAKRLHTGAAMSWSAGVAQARGDDTVPGLMHRADQRMYRQKASRRIVG